MISLTALKMQVASGKALFKMTPSHYFDIYLFKGVFSYANDSKAVM